MDGNSPEQTKVLERLWICSGQMCSKRLKPALLLWLEHYEKHHGALTGEYREKLLMISSASIDRVLKPFKAQVRRSLEIDARYRHLYRSALRIHCQSSGDPEQYSRQYPA
ncbi:MAG: hypothetical protein JXR25_14055 [Pontiellaceae bacterium]|nr:hypothetical protein [Pontiellaceae bacterium]